MRERGARAGVRDVAGERLTTTEDHPFWNATDQAWERADSIDRGDHIGTADGRIAKYRRLSGHPRWTTAYNLTVQGVHTYHVGRRGLLVHNSDLCGVGGNVGPGWFPFGTNKIPRGWSGPAMTSKFRGNPGKAGFVWRSRAGQDSVRIDRGNPNSPFPSQRVDHVVINSGGSIVGRNGVPFPPGTRIKDVASDAHVPLSEWETWRSWNAP